MEGYTSKRIKHLGKGDHSIKKEDFIGDAVATRFAIVIDPSGKCRWDSNSITGDHIVEILTESVPTAYLKHLREKQVSYIFAGRKSVNLELVLRKLRSLFGIKRLLLEAGGVTNGLFLRNGLVDELSQLNMPLADGSTGTSTLFDVEEGYTSRKATKLKLKSVSRLSGGVLWIRYLMRN